MYAGSDSQILCEQFGGQITEEEILRCTDLAKDLQPDVVVGIGGGKTMDTAKAVADNYKAAVIIVPTTASTDAPAMGLSVIAGMAVSKACHETVLAKGVNAKLAAEKGLCTKDVEDVIEANTLLSGLGVQNTSCAGAHSIAEGITVLEPCAKLLHGEVVAFGILVQLIVEGAPKEEIDEMYDFFNKVGLPSTFADLGIADATDEDIMKVAEASMHSYWDVEPFAVNPRMIADAIILADALGKQKK